MAGDKFLRRTRGFSVEYYRIILYLFVYPIKLHDFYSMLGQNFCLRLFKIGIFGRVLMQFFDLFSHFSFHRGVNVLMFDESLKPVRISLRLGPPIELWNGSECDLAPVIAKNL